jgi:hypothetical protein
MSKQKRDAKQEIYEAKYCIQPGPILVLKGRIRLGKKVTDMTRTGTGSATLHLIVQYTKSTSHRV